MLSDNSGNFVEPCVDCPYQGRCVGYKGNPEARLVIVGEAPGQQELARGVPFCLDEGTLVLTSKLQWKPLGEIQIGDELLACDETGSETKGVSGFGTRYWRISRVLNKVVRQSEAFRVETDKGELIATPEHRVLTASVGGRKWLRVDQLQDGLSKGNNWLRTGSTKDDSFGSVRTSSIAFVFSPWSVSVDYDFGWLGGFLDGEGTIRYHRALQVGFAQNPGPVYTRAVSLIREKGFDLSPHYRDGYEGPTGIQCIQAFIRGGIGQQLSFLGRTQPTRLIGTLQRILDSNPKGIRMFPAKVLSRRLSVGIRNVVDITTSTGTFIANGFVVHNCGPSGELLDHCLEKAGLSHEGIFITNALNCRPSVTPPEDKAIRSCHQRLADELSLAPRKLIIALGNSALRSITSNYSLKITNERGKPVQTDWGLMIPAFHPAAILRKRGDMPKLQDDFAYAADLYFKGREAIKGPGEVKWNVATEENIDQIVTGLRKYSLLAVDIETHTFNPRLGRILCVGICWQKNRAVIIPERLVPNLKDLFEDPNIQFLWHNGKYDTSFLFNYGIRARVDQDSMLVSYALNEHGGEHSLKDLAADLLGSPDYKDVVKRFAPKKTDSFAKIPKKYLWPYLAQDADNTFQVYEILRDQLNSDAGPRWAYEHILIPGSALLREVENAGMFIDQNEIKSLRRSLVESTTQQVATMEELCGREFNPNSPKQLMDILRDFRVRIPNTRSETLEMFKSHPFVTQLMAYRKDIKSLGTYVNGILERVEPDGRVHPTYLLHGTATGRLSCRNPNLQNITRGSAIKRIFGAPDGYGLGEIDFSQCIAEDTWVGDVRIQDHPDAVYKGISPTVIVHTKRGYSVECTADHKILTATGWKRATDLEADDWVALEGKRVSTHEPDPYWWAIGFWVGDGSMNSVTGQISYSRVIDEDAQELEEALVEAFGTKPLRYSTTSFNVSNLGLSNTRKLLREFFDKKDLRIPFEAVGDHLGPFLSGLFDADGYVSKVGVSLSTKFEGLARDVQYALLRFGIMSTVRVYHSGFYPSGRFNPDGLMEWRVLIGDNCSLINFRNCIGFKLTRKSTKLDSTISKKVRDKGNYLPVPWQEVAAQLSWSRQVSRKRTEYELRLYQRYIGQYLHGKPYTRRTLQEFSFPTWQQYHWDQVETIRASDRSASVYDLMDQQDQRFSANGIIVHNCELRVLAHLANDDFLTHVYMDGRDMHAEMAEILYPGWHERGGESTPEGYEQRVRAKFVGFGIAYGRGGRAIAEQFGLPEYEGHRLVATWLARAPKARDYLEGCSRIGMKGGTLVSPFGRKRRFGLVTREILHEIKNESRNFPIQSAASDLTLISAIRALPTLRRMGVSIVNLVHDSILIEAPLGVLEEACEYVISIMIETPKITLHTSVPFDADAKVGSLWGDMHTLKRVTVAV